MENITPIAVDENAAAIITGISVSSLRKLRVTGGGPKFAKLGQRVRYRVADLEDYVAQRVVSSTSEEPKAA
jgi:predicted DNA-binding transcriptional regulator AlpA